MKELKMKLEKETLIVMKETLLNKEDVLGECKICGEQDLEYSLTIVDLHGQIYNRCPKCFSTQSCWVDISISGNADVEISDEDFDEMIEQIED